MKTVFLILHYISILETEKCVEAILKNYKDAHVVIVDNGSLNNSGLKLKEKYKDYKNIHILLNKENLGFAKGNNVGFKYAKETLKADFIVMINNDVIINQPDFIEKIEEEYTKSNFSVLGPKINLNGKVLNYPDKLPDIKELKYIRRIDKLLYYFNKIYLRYIISLYIKISKKLKKEKYINTNIRKENVLLNGCCLIFSKNYINLFDGIDDRTFLYYEEQLLFLRLKKNNLKSVYNPNIQINHNESISTNESIKKKRKKFDFKLKNEINSLNILIKEMENFNEKY